MSKRYLLKARIIQEIHINQKKTFDLRNLFVISKDVNVAFIVKKFRSMKGCILCKYNSSNNTLSVFGNEEFLQLSEKLMVVIEKHYSNISPKTENFPETKIMSKVKHQSLTLNKNIFDLVKSKLDSFKKQYSIRFDIKQKKDNKIVLEWDYKDEKINDFVVSELSLNEYYFENLKLHQEFFKTDSYPSFNHYLDKFKTGIEYYNIFPVDENTYNLNIIGKENILLKLNVILTKLVSHYQTCSEKDNELKIIKNDIDEIGKKYGRILGN